jgi:hypothetical protein
MRRVAPSVLLALLLPLGSLLPLGAVDADDEAPKPPAVAADECEALIDGLLSDNAVAREVAEAGLAKADDALLRRLVARLVRRLGDAPSIELPPEEGHVVAPDEPRPAPDAEPLDPNAPLIELKFRLVDASPAAAERLLALGKAGADGNVAFDAARLAAELETLAASGEATPITAPHITTLAGQRANVSVLQQIAYVQDYEVESGSNVADPIIATLQEGLVLDLLAKPAGSGVLVDATLTLSDVVRPIPEFKTALAAGGPEVTIQMPEVHVQRTQKKLIAPAASPVLLGSLSSPSRVQGRRLLAFLDANLLPAPR